MGYYSYLFWETKLAVSVSDDASNVLAPAEIILCKHTQAIAPIGTEP